MLNLKVIRLLSIGRVATAYGYFAILPWGKASASALLEGEGEMACCGMESSPRSEWNARPHFFPVHHFFPETDEGNTEEAQRALTALTGPAWLAGQSPTGNVYKHKSHCVLYVLSLKGFTPPSRSLFFPVAAAPDDVFVLAATAALHTVVSQLCTRQCFPCQLATTAEVKKKNQNTFASNTYTNIVIT